MTSTTDADGRPAPAPTRSRGTSARSRSATARACSASSTRHRGRAPTRSLDAVSEAGSRCGRCCRSTSRTPAASSSTCSPTRRSSSSLDGLPSATPTGVDGATFPVPRDADDADGPVSSYRIVLNPQRPRRRATHVLDRLVRHELTHVALGDHARGVPLWLSEGLAEYVSVQPLAPAERGCRPTRSTWSRRGRRRSRGRASSPVQHAEGWYAVSWWVCEYIAATYGEPALWTLLDGLADGADQQTVVSDQLGISTSDLVQAGIGLMRAPLRLADGDAVGQYRFPVTPLLRLVHIVDDVPSSTGWRSCGWSWRSTASSTPATPRRDRGRAPACRAR